MVSLGAARVNRWMLSGAVAVSLIIGVSSAASADWFHRHGNPHEHHEDALHHHSPHQERHGHHHPRHHHTPHHLGQHHRGTFHAWRHSVIRVFPSHRRRQPYRLAQHDAHGHEGSHTNSAVHEGAPALGDLLNEGDVAFKRSDYGRAAEAFHQAAVRYPEHPIPHFAYGHTLFALGRYAEATAAIRAGMARHTDWGTMRMNRREFYTDPSEFDGQLHRLEEWVSAHPEDAEAQFLLGYHYYFTQQPQRAKEVFERVIPLNPNDREARYFLSLLVGAEEV